MQNTRSQIVDILKKQGKASVDELAGSLSLSSMTVRQHLSILQREDFVDADIQRRSLGRPHHVYSLTHKGEDLFPKNYQVLTERLLDQIRNLDAKDISGLNAEAKLRLIFEKMADKLASSHRGRLFDKPLVEQVKMVTTILNDEGNLAEWRDDGHEYTIIDYNCPYLRIAETNSHICAFHLRFLGNLFERKVVRRRCLVDGDTFCCYHIAKEDSVADNETVLAATES